MYACVCFQVTDAHWAEALASAQAEGKSWREASSATGAGQGCGGCRPYLAQTAVVQEFPLPIIDPVPASA